MITFPRSLLENLYDHRSEFIDGWGSVTVKEDGVSVKVSYWDYHVDVTITVEHPMDCRYTYTQERRISSVIFDTPVQLLESMVNKVISDLLPVMITLTIPH